ncbi:hypothetical protein GF339_04000, partial [candidate division KSB3 bacterium]|nr:hypothetical protein [candidate division KSB3 bacterium]MBD3323722.1 hypothetical protein [candidate division KSB3 bacterium]
MSRLRVKLLAYRGADEACYTEGKEKFGRLLEPQHVEFVDQQPEVLFFLSGGSERGAAACLEAGRFYLFLACQEGNSYAAALEVKAYCEQQGIRSVLLDYAEHGTRGFVRHLYAVLQGLQRLQGQRLGLLGNVSDWLIASNIAPELLQKRLGIRLIQAAWETLPDYRDQPVSEELLRTFQQEDPTSLAETGKVCT